MNPRAFALVIALFAASTLAALGDDKPAAKSPEPIALWPGVAPGEKGNIGEERDMSKPNEKGIIRLGNVSKPTITIYKPPADKDTGAAVVVCPGGGYYILAWDLEGTEVCEWLNSLGVTGVLLKYRVPSRDKLNTAPLQDVQRAIGLVRQHAAEWQIDPKRVGVLGFSAGGHLAAAVSNHFDKRAYEPIDDADKQSCRPDFAVLIYPAYLADRADITKLAPDMTVTKDTPPTFIVQTQDDGVKVENAYVYGLALKQNKVPAEIHIYPIGGHGYGLRPSKNNVSHWPQRVAEWMGASGWLTKG